MYAAAAAVLLKLDGKFTLKEEQTTALKTFLSGEKAFFLELTFVSRPVRTTQTSKSSYRCAIHTTQLDVNNKVCDATLLIGANLNFLICIFFPLFSGTGYSILVIQLYGTVYCIILAWALFYLVQSFRNPLPWATCDNPWNTGQQMSVRLTEAIVLAAS